MTSQERVFKICMTKPRVIHVWFSILKQYQMMMSSVARVKFIKTEVIFRYHTRGISNQVSSNLDHKIRSYLRSNSNTKMVKNEKVGKNFLGYKTMWLRDNKSGQVLAITNRGKSYYQ